MSYEILQFNLGSGAAQAYVLRGLGEHEGTNEPISLREMHENSKDGPTLAHFLDYRFLRAHGERVARELAPPS